MGCLKYAKYIKTSCLPSIPGAKTLHANDGAHLVPIPLLLAYGQFVRLIFHEGSKNGAHVPTFLLIAFGQLMFVNAIFSSTFLLLNVIIHIFQHIS